MKTPELKPCPFCGGKATIREKGHGYTGAGEFLIYHEIGCCQCEITFEGESRFRIKDGQAVFSVNAYEKCINAWNRRTSDGALIVD